MAAFDWSQYFNLAKELSTRPEEAALRSAISRAYYAAYNLAEIYCGENTIPITDSGNPHQDVWNAFLAKGGASFTTIYDKGTRLKRKRKLADYKDDIDRLASIVNDSIRDADDILKRLNPPPAAPAGSATPTTPADGSTPPTA